jgi:hypothetical protein
MQISRILAALTTGLLLARPAQAIDLDVNSEGEQVSRSPLRLGAVR